MKLAIASGKGGTGKTTLAVNLAHLAAQKRGQKVMLLDCDVEEPNAHLFFPEAVLLKEERATIPVPKVDEEKCDGCTLCSQFCAFNAIVTFGTTPSVFPEMCHGCGGCMRVCPQKAIKEMPFPIGSVIHRQQGPLTLISGLLDIGIAMAPPLIKAVKKAAPQDSFLIYDAPPGTSCPVIETLKDADFTLFVTEPTPFGLHDLDLAVKMARAIGASFAVVINRATLGKEDIKSYCRQENIDVFAEIPHDEAYAKSYARGALFVDNFPELRDIFQEILDKTEKQGAAA